MSERQCHLGDVIGEPLPPMRMPYSRHYEPADWVVNIKHFVVATVGMVFWSILLIVLLASMFLAAKKAVAQVHVPPECVQLAIREGYPTDVLSRAQAARARIRISRLSDNDPIVRSCREAIAQLKAAQREMRR